MKIKLEVTNLCCKRKIKIRLTKPVMTCTTKEELDVFCPRCERTDTVIVHSFWEVEKKETRGKHRFSWRFKSPMKIKGGKINV